MVLLRCGDSFMFASSWTRKEIAETMVGNDLDSALLELCWFMESCAEAIEVLEDFDECPVCLRRVDDEGVLRHKLPWLLNN